MFILGKGFFTASALFVAICVINGVTCYGYTFTMPIESINSYGERAKRSLATICVEIKPNGPLEEPYYMCRGSDLPPFPKFPSINTKFSYSSGSSESANKQSASAYGENDNFGASYNARGDGNSDAHIQSLTNKYSTQASNSKSGFSHTDSQSINQQEYSSGSSGSGTGSGASSIDSELSSNTQTQLNGGVSYNSALSSDSKNQFSGGSTAGALYPQKAVPTYHKPAEQLQTQFGNVGSEYKQNFQSTQVHSNQQQQQNFHQQQQQLYQQQLQQQQLQQQQQQQQLFQQQQHYQQQMYPPQQQNLQHQHGQQSFSYQQQSKEFFRPSLEIEHSLSTSDKLKSHDSTYTDSGSNEKTSQNQAFSGAYGTTQAHGISQPFKNTASTGSSFTSTHSSNTYETSQNVQGANSDCGEDCGQPAIRPASTGGGVALNGFAYTGQHPATSSGHDPQSATKSPILSAGNSQSQQSPIAAISIGNDAISPVSTNAANAATSDTRATHSSSARFATSAAAAFVPAERPAMSFVGVPDAPKLPPAFLRSGSAALNNKYQQEAHPYGITSGGGKSSQMAHHQVIQYPSVPPQQYQHQSPQPVSPASRYRAMIDEEVLQMPNWGFTPEEFEMYRSMSDDDEPSPAPILSQMHPHVHSQLRTIPLEHLEDPVMRTFYDSLPDVGPLPIYHSGSQGSYIQIPTQSHRMRPQYVQHQPVQRPPAQPQYIQPQYVQPQRVAPKTAYHSQQQSCAPVAPEPPQPTPPPIPQYYNYNPCPPAREYTFQPVFIALPCLGQPLYQQLVNPSTGNYASSQVATSGYESLSMANPMADPLTRLLSVGNPVTNLLTSAQVSSTPSPIQQQPQKKITSISSSKEQHDSRPKPQVTTTTTAATTILNDSNESSDSVEEVTKKKGLTAVTSTNDDNNSAEGNSGSMELKEEITEKVQTAKFTGSFNESTKVMATTLDDDAPAVAMTLSSTTPSAADSFNDEQDGNTQSRTTFKSLIGTARRLAMMVQNDNESSQLQLEATTPKPTAKKQRQVSKPMMNGNNSARKKFMKETQK